VAHLLVTISGSVGFPLIVLWHWYQHHSIPRFGLLDFQSCDADCAMQHRMKQKQKANL
jgi:hypothetical protein